MQYGERKVLHGVDLTVCRGEVVALLGPNGAGKTTTIEILEGFRTRTGGDVNVLGCDPERGDEAWRARVGIVLQSWRDHSRWRVLELLDHLGRFYSPFGTPERPRPYDAQELAALVGLSDQALTRVAHLSGGQRRRLDVAIGVVGRPDVLFLDEPTVGFDPQARQEFHDLVRGLARSEGTTILLTTHDLDEAEKLSDRIVILARGSIVADGSAAELSRQASLRAEVRYSLNGQPRTCHVENATAYVRELFAEHGDAVSDLEVRRATLQEVYLSIVQGLNPASSDDARLQPAGVTP
jgi:ABC-2 type transport system ATP-binding protein